MCSSWFTIHSPIVPQVVRSSKELEHGERCRILAGGRAVRSLCSVCSRCVLAVLTYGFGAQGKGLHEKVTSVQHHLPPVRLTTFGHAHALNDSMLMMTCVLTIRVSLLQDLVRKIRYLCVGGLTMHFALSMRASNLISAFVPWMQGHDTQQTGK